jgi:hypothetical protein
MTPLSSPEHLNAWTHKFCGFTLPDCRVTEFADSTPLEFVWEIYRAMMDGKPVNVMGLCGRDGAKTVSLSVIDLLSLLHDQRPAIHAGAITSQAQRAREYLQKYVFSNPILTSMVVKENQRFIILNVDGIECGLELISLKPKQVQGAHYAMCSVDELASTVEPEVKKAYRDFAGVPCTSRKGKPAIKIRITSRQASYSLAEKDIDEAPKTGMQVRKWSTIDCMSRCEPSRSGSVPTPIYIDTIKGKHCTPEAFKALPIEEKNGFKYAPDVMDGCLKCPLLLYCKGRARFQTSESVLLRSIDDVIGKVFDSGSHEWVLSQMLSMKPLPDTLVYGTFDESIHVPSWGSLWKTLTGEVAPEEVGRAQLVHEMKKRGCNFYCGMDFGWTVPSTAVVVAVDAKDNVYVVESLGKTRQDDPDWVEFVARNVNEKYDVQMYCPDPENKSACSLLRKAGMSVAEVDKGPGTVRSGINVIKGLLREPGTLRPRLFIFPDVPRKGSTGIPGIIEEFGYYSYEADVTGRILDDKNPTKENDHFLDGLRYVTYWLYGKNAFRVGTDYVDEKPFADTGEKQTNIPSLEDIARRYQISYVDNREEIAQRQVEEQRRQQAEVAEDDKPYSGGLLSAWDV